MSYHLLDPAYQMFPESEQARVIELGHRYAILEEDCDALVEDFIADYVSSKRTATWGPPDTSKMPIITVSRAMSTPGHYGHEPTVSGMEGDEDYGGAMAATLRLADWSPIMQTVEYLAYGMNTCGVRPSWSQDLGRLVLHVCPSHHLWFDAHGEDPAVATVQRQLTVVVGDDGREFYAWHVWDVTGPEPSYRVLRAKRGGEMGEDVTLAAVGHNALVGAGYPYVDEFGKAFTPIVLYRTIRDGSMWSWHRGKGAFRGSLMTVLYNSHAGKCARDAVSKGGIVFDAKPVGGTVGFDGNGSPTLALDFEAGDILHYEATGNAQPTYKPIDAGANLPEVWAFSKEYGAGVGEEMGMAPTDAVRVGSNPMSGLALYLSNDNRRQEQHRIAPLMRSADLRLFEAVAALSTRAGMPLPRTGYDVEYYQIPLSPQEERERREADSWEMEQGFKSPVDVMMERYPALSREDAIARLRRVAEENRIVNGGTSDV